MILKFLSQKVTVIVSFFVVITSFSSLSHSSQNEQYKDFDKRGWGKEVIKESYLQEVDLFKEDRDEASTGSAFSKTIIESLKINMKNFVDLDGVEKKEIKPEYDKINRVKNNFEQASIKNSKPLNINTAIDSNKFRKDEQAGVDQIKEKSESETAGRTDQVITQVDLKSASSDVNRTSEGVKIFNEKNITVIFFDKNEKESGKDKAEEKNSQTISRSQE